MIAAIASLPAQTATPDATRTPSQDLPQFKTAKELWAHIEALKKGPEQKPKNEEEMVGFILQMDAAVADFLKRFPDDTHKWEARMMAGGIAATLANQFGRKDYDPKKIETVAREVEAAADAPAEIKREARFLLLMGALTKNATPELGPKIAEFAKDYPNDPTGVLLKLQYGKKLMATNPAQAEKLLGEVAAIGIPELAVEARSSLKIMKTMLNKPLDMKFTAADGTPVDLDTMRGKVVLVQFWATWNAPSMKHVQALVDSYKKYHDKGFEIIGVTLDDDKEAMLKIAGEKGMVWPQYFDGKGYENRFTSAYGINAIPVFWLVNKKGVLVNTEARTDMDGNIEKLLAE